MTIQCKNQNTSQWSYFCDVQIPVIACIKNNCNNLIDIYKYYIYILYNIKNDKMREFNTTEIQQNMFTEKLYRINNSDVTVMVMSLMLSLPSKILSMIEKILEMNALISNGTLWKQSI